MRATVETASHAHNADPTAKLEWSRGEKSVYAVRGGFVAIIGWGKAVDGLFPSLNEARDFLLSETFPA